MAAMVPRPAEYPNPRSIGSRPPDPRLSLDPRLWRCMVRVFNSTQAALRAEYGIEIGRWSQYDGVDILPFQAMWCIVPPASHSVQDCHPEVELAVVVGGQARMVFDDRMVEVPSGAAV